MGVTRRVTVHGVAVAAGCRKALVKARWAIVLLSCKNGPRKHSFCLVGAHFRQPSVQRSAPWSGGPDY